MKKTIFRYFVEKYFLPIVNAITERFNGQSKEPEFLHKTMLTEEYSADLNWGATQLNHSIVAADVVALDSSLPLKHRGSLALATGTLPKLGMKYFKGEKDISDIRVMSARGADEATIAGKIFDDAANAIRGIDIRNECMFLQGLSTGMVLVSDEDTPGTGIRVSFGYRERNTFHATTAKWGDADATPIDDIRQLFDRADADGVALNHVWMSRKYFNYARSSEQGKLLAATFQSQVITDKTLLPMPSTEVFRNALEDEFGAVFHVINSAFKYELVSGKHLTVRPWEEANVVATPSDTVGRLVYGTLAEEDSPVEGVTYTKSGSYTLVSKYSKTDPLREFTASQALCLPVIDGADSIYLLHAGTTSKDALSVEPESLTFTKKAQTKTASIHYDGSVSDLTAEAGADWLEVSVTAAKKVSVKTTVNGGAERTATVTVAAGDLSDTLTVTQKGDGTTGTDGDGSGNDGGNDGDGGNTENP